MGYSIKGQRLSERKDFSRTLITKYIFSRAGALFKREYDPDHPCLETMMQI